MPDPRPGTQGDAPPGVLAGHRSWRETVPTGLFPTATLGIPLRTTDRSPRRRELAEHGMGGWRKSPPEMVERFMDGTGWLLAEPGVQRRQMFGYPACFVDGNMFTSLFADRWVVRLPDDARTELSALGGTGFEPVPGRPMTGYLLLPPGLAEPEAARPWVARALAHARTLPPKKPRAAGVRSRR